MKINRTTGILMSTKYIPSPNCDERLSCEDVDLLIIHNISLPPGKFNNTYIVDFFTNQLQSTSHPYFKSIEHLKVSAHCLIKRDGEIIQFVPFNKRAWHAGESHYNGRSSCNDFSIGIELEGTDDIPYTKQQYVNLAKLIASIQQVYFKITNDKIVGHQHVAPKRKTDPGPAFDWLKLKQLLMI